MGYIDNYLKEKQNDKIFLETWEQQETFIVDFINNLLEQKCPYFEAEMRAVQEFEKKISTARIGDIVRSTIIKEGIPKGRKLKVTFVNKNGDVATTSLRKNDWTTYYLDKGEFVVVQSDPKFREVLENNTNQYRQTLEGLDEPKVLNEDELKQVVHDYGASCVDEDWAFWSVVKTLDAEQKNHERLKERHDTLSFNYAHMRAYLNEHSPDILKKINLKNR